MTYDPNKYITSRGHVRAFVLMYGNPTDGIKVVGPWTNPDEIKDWVQRMCLKEGEWWLSYLYHPLD